MERTSLRRTLSGSDSVKDVIANQWRRLSRQKTNTEATATTTTKRRNTAVSVDDFIPDYASSDPKGNVEHRRDEELDNGSLGFEKEKQLNDEAEVDVRIIVNMHSAGTSVTSLNSESSFDTEQAEQNKPPEHGLHNMHNLIEELLHEVNTSSSGSPPTVRCSGVAPGRSGCVVRTLSDLSTVTHQTYLFEDETCPLSCRESVPTPILQRRISRDCDRRRKASAWWANERALLLSLNRKFPFERVEL